MGTRWGRVVVLWAAIAGGRGGEDVAQPGLAVWVVETVLGDFGGDWSGGCEGEEEEEGEW